MTTDHSGAARHKRYKHNAGLPWVFDEGGKQAGPSVHLRTQDGHYLAEVYQMNGVDYAFVQRLTNRRIPDRQVYNAPLNAYAIEAHVPKGYLRKRLQALVRTAHRDEVSEHIHLTMARHSVWCNPDCSYAEYIDTEAEDAARNAAAWQG